jgi:hypothetical protein
MRDRKILVSVFLTIVLVHNVPAAAEVGENDDYAPRTVCMNHDPSEQVDPCKAPPREKRRPPTNAHLIDEPVENEDMKYPLLDAFPTIIWVFSIQRPRPGIKPLPIRLRRAVAQAILSGRLR